jgi:signal transduction histidine kinase
MFRRRTTLVALAVLVLFLGVVAFGITKAQDGARNGVVDRFNERAGFGSLFMGAILDLSAQQRGKDAARYLGGPNPDEKVLRSFVKKVSPQQSFARLLDSKGRVLAAIPDGAAADRDLLAHNPDLAAGVHRGTWFTGNVIKTPGGGQVVELATPFDTPQGRRVVGIGGSVVLFDAVMKSFLKGVPAVRGGQAYILDANNRVLASATNFKAGGRLKDAPLIEAMDRRIAGSYKSGESRRFVRHTVPNSSLRVALSVPESSLFAAGEGAGRLVWVLFGGFAIALLGGLLQLSRVHTRNRQLALAEQRQRARAELAREQQRADGEAERLKSEFFGIVSHELRTPLTSIMGYVDLLRERDRDQLSEDGQGRLEVVHRNAGRLDRLVQDLLMLTQLEAGTFGIELGEVDMCELARNCEPEARLMAELAGIEFSIDCQQVPVFGGDARRISQVLDNLISNAIKFTPKGGRVGVRIAAEGECCVLEVSDNGVGIEEKDRAQLFKRFYRGEAVPAGKVPGAGLGLAITQAIVDSHGGKIAVDSAPGRGSTFRVFIPARPVPVEPSHHAEPSRQATVGQSA